LLAGVELDDAGVAPQTLDLVILAFGLGEHVDDHVTVVEQHPAKVTLALSTDGLSRRERSLDLRHDGSNLTVGCSRADDEKVTDLDELRDVKDRNVDRLLGRSSPGRFNRQGFG
jgi:hypothetical protein